MVSSLGLRSSCSVSLVSQSTWNSFAISFMTFSLNSPSGRVTESLTTNYNTHTKSQRSVHIMLTNHKQKMMGPYYINYGELNIVKNKIDKSIPKIKKKMIQLQRRDIISFFNSKYVP